MNTYTVTIGVSTFNIKATSHKDAVYRCTKSRSIYEVSKKEAVATVVMEGDVYKGTPRYFTYV